MSRHILRSGVRLLSRLLGRESSGYTFSSVVPMGVPFPVGKLPDGSTYTQALGANQTQETVQISPRNTSYGVRAIVAVANLPRVGRASDGSIGLYRAPPRTNITPRNTAMHAANWATQVNVTTDADAVVAPDGTTTAERTTDNTTNGVHTLALSTEAVTAVKHSVSAFLKQGTLRYTGVRFSSSTGHELTVDLQTKAVTSSVLLAESKLEGGAGGWIRATLVCTPAAGVTSSQIYLSNNGGVYGAYAGATTHVGLWGYQAEVGEYPSPLIITGATTAARAGSLHAIPLSGGYLRNGRLRFESDHAPMGAADKYATDGAAIRLWTLDTNTYAEITTATRALTVVVNGVARVAGVAVGWSADTRTHWVWEVGNGSLFVRYRISTDAGVTWGLPFDPFGGTVHTDAEISTTATELHTFSDGVSAKYFGTVEIGWRPLVSAVPAWALQALPTDVASVKAFFRADGGTTLNGSTVSAWGGQTATAVTAFTQGTAAKQPTYEAAGFATARPSLTLDGAGDGMTGPTGASCLTNSEGTIYVLWKPTAFINDSATLYNNDAIVGDTGGAAYGIFGRGNTPRFFAYNYDGTVDTSATSAAVVETTYVLRWRHSGGNIYLRVNGGTESVAVASGNTAALTTISIGFGWDGGRYASGRMGGLVIANAALTVANDAAIMSFLNVYGGIA